jgi:perosamine synthetase
MPEARRILISQPLTGEEEWQAVKEPLMTGWLTQGPKVAELEKAFAARHKVKHAYSCTNCTAGLHLCLCALGVGPGDEVIVPSFTWVSSANAVMYCGAKPVLADVNTTTYTLDPAEVARKVTPRTKAVVAVHLFGLCADIDAIKAAAPNAAIVEDSACASGASYKGVPAGGLGSIAAFSFHPRKSVTCGEGGMVTTNDDALGAIVNSLRNHGASISEEQRHAGPRPYLLPEFNMLGFNYRMTDLQGAVAMVQLAKLDAFIAERAKWAQYYRRELADIKWLRLPEQPDGYGHGWQSFVTFVDPASAPMPRNDIMELLQARGIATRPGTHAVHMLGYYRQTFGYQIDDLPGSRDCDLHTMAIPLHNRMSSEDFAYVVDALRQIDSQGKNQK